MALLYEAFLEVVPDDFNVWYNLGNHLGRLDRKVEAIGAYDMALRIKPEFARAHYNRGRVRYDLGHFDEAIVDFIEAARYDCDVEEFPYAITRRIIPIYGFVAMVNIIAQTLLLPANQRENLALAVRTAIDNALAIDGWYLSSLPGLPRSTTQQSTVLILHAMLADIRRDSPIESEFPFFHRARDGYEVKDLDETSLRKAQLVPPAYRTTPDS